jgi:hypothetical protein
MVSRPELDLPLTGLPSLVLRLAIAFGCAELSYRWIETPVRDGALGRLWAYMTRDHGPLRWMLAGAWALSIAALCVEVGAAKPPPIEPHSDDVWIAKPRPIGTGDFEEPELAGLGVNAAGDGPIGAALPNPVKPGVRAAPPAAVRGKEDANANAGSPDVHAAQNSVQLASVAPLPNIGQHLTRVFAIGDSVMLGAAKHLRVAGTQVTIDAVVGRQASAVVDVLEQLKASGEKPEVVLIHIGNNGTLREQQFEAMVKLLKNVPNVVFVNTKVPRRWQDPNNAVLKEGARRHSQVLLVDWLNYSQGHPEWFRSDGYHLQPDGAEAYAALLRPFYSLAREHSDKASAL